MSKPSVAIVIPTFNRASFVTKAIESSLDQTYPCQVVVCDHGSRDNTPEVVARYSDKVNYIRRETDFGPHFCWLDGVMNAEAEFIHIQYDDDWIDAAFIEKTLALMDENIGMVFSNVTVLDLGKEDHPDPDEAPRLFSKSLDYLKTGVYDNKVLDKIILKKGLNISPGACLFRKKDIVDSLYQGALPIKSSNEYHGVGPDLFMTLLTLLRYEKFGFVDEVLAFFGSHPDSITINAIESEDKNKQLLTAYDEVRRYYKTLKLHNVIKRFL